MICVEVDELTPCLKDMRTGELVDTEVIRIVRKSFLTKYNKKNGWYVNWSSLLTDNEVYALVIKGTVDIQGLVALRFDKDVQSTYVSWMVASPENNPQLGSKRYAGVGGHLFAVAADRAEALGSHGEFYGYAANEKLLQHYVDSFDAIYVGMLHTYHFVISQDSARQIMEAYTYEWTDEEI